MTELYLLIEATSTTLQLALCALIIGLMLAISFTILEELRMSKWLIFLGKMLILLLCGLPEILIILFIYLVTPQLLTTVLHYLNNICYVYLDFTLPIEHINVNPLVCGIIALSLIYAAYAYQTLHEAIQNISKGQWESGQALGMSNSVIFVHLILPQIWKLALPGLGNQWLVLLKDTTLVSLISVNDLMFQTKNMIYITHKPFTWYMLSALIYLCITLLSQTILLFLERFTNRFEKNIPNV